MSRFQWLRPVLDMAMTLLLLLLMSYQIMPQAVHVGLGLLFLALLLLHAADKRRWYAALGRGRYTAVRLLPALVNLLLPLCFLLTIGSGLIMVTPSVPFFRSWMAPARDIHLSLSHWVLLLSAVHLGLHGAMITTRMKRALPALAFRILSGLVYAAAIFGIWSFYDTGMIRYLFLQVRFAFFDPHTPALLVIGKYLSIFILTAWVTHKGYTRLQKQGRRR